MRGRWVVMLLLAVAAPAVAADPLLEQVDVYKSGEDGYEIYRIPGIETAPDGTLLAFAEARKYGGADPGFGKQDIDLVLKRSNDGGKTWSEMTIVEDPGEHWSAANPATVVDRDTGKVWVLYLRSKPGRSTITSRPGTDDMQTQARWSADNGATWSEPFDLTAVARDMNDETWKASVVGPGGAIQAQNGRLLAPIWKSPYNVFAIYSEDHGKTWHRGQCAPGGDRGDEDQLVELSDGRILMDMRQSGGGTRWRTTSSDGGQTWSEPFAGEAVTPCACAIERLTLKSAGDDRDRILWTGPKGPGRNTLMARLSYDEGKTFPVERIISAEPAAYSDLAMLKDGTVGCLWERANYRFITFTRFNLAFLEPKGPPAEPTAELKVLEER
ncbi:MAG: sialidase family protein [Planctomycetota bacterium]